MTYMRKVATATGNFLTDYCRRHAHPVNAVLHLIGVPMVLFGLYELTQGKAAQSFFLIVLGYLLQYLGHRAQGNEVGEVTLIKHIWLHFCGRRS